MNNINLVGYRGCGKTAVGRKLAEVLQRPFVDSDIVIVERAVVSIAEFVAKFGWEYFRRLEAEVIRDCCQQDEIVLATGGGVVLACKNRRLLQKSGVNFWLQASSDTILERLDNDPQSLLLRPPLSTLDRADEIQVGLKEREPFYRDLADFMIPVDQCGVDGIVLQIVKILEEE